MCCLKHTRGIAGAIGKRTKVYRKLDMTTPDQRQRTGSEASDKHGCAIGMSGSLQGFLLAAPPREIAEWHAGKR